MENELKDATDRFFEELGLRPLRFDTERFLAAYAVHVRGEGDLLKLLKLAVDASNAERRIILNAATKALASAESDRRLAFLDDQVSQLLQKSAPFGGAQTVARMILALVCQHHGKAALAPQSEEVKRMTVHVSAHYEKGIRQTSKWWILEAEEICGIPFRNNDRDAREDAIKKALNRARKRCKAQGADSVAGLVPELVPATAAPPKRGSKRKANRD